MSNEPAPAPAPLSPEPRADTPVSDTAKVLAALARMEAAMRRDERERPMAQRLHAELGEVAGDIAKAQDILRPFEAVAALLRELERRVGAMIALVEPAPEGAPSPAEAEQAAVPTVSNVVSRLGVEGEAAQPPAPASDDVPTVAMLGAMVEALTAPAPESEQTLPEPAQPEPEAAAPPEALAEVQADTPPAAASDDVPPAAMLGAMVEALTAPAPESEQTLPEPAQPEPEAAAPPEALAETQADAPDTPASDDVPTVAMLGATVEAPTAPAPESEQTLPEPAAPEPEAGAPPEALAEAQADTPPAAPEEPQPRNRLEPPHPMMPEIDLLWSAAQIESVLYPPPELGTAVIFQQPQETTPAAVAPKPETPPAVIEPEAVPSATLDQMIASWAPVPQPEPDTVEAPPAEPHDADSDPAAFLLEPPPATADDPAAFLLDPIPPARVPPAVPPPLTEAAPPAVRGPQTAKPPPADPLAALKAMSEHEKIALFS